MERRTSSSKSNRTEVRYPKLKPINEKITSLNKYDCCAFIIHCAAHNKILIYNFNNVIWMPYMALLPNVGWIQNAQVGFLLIVSNSDVKKYHQLKDKPPYEEHKCIQVLRFQLPRSMKFVTRLTYYFRLKPGASDFKCCQNHSSLEWYSLTKIQNAHIPNLWGPELVKFSKLRTEDTQIMEYGLEEAFLYVPRDPPRNMEEDMLKTIRITEKDVERLYEDFLDHCFPSFYLTLESFKYYMKKRDFEKNDTRLQRFFRAFNYTKKGFLSFHEFLLGLACMEPTIQHGKLRVKFIFRFYSDDSATLSKENLRRLLYDLNPDESTLEQRFRHAVSVMKGGHVDSHSDKIKITEREFVSSIGNHKFRGTSALCRYPKGIFNHISRAVADKGLHKAKTVLSTVPISRGYKGTCKVCKEKRYYLATHFVHFDAAGNLKSKPVNDKVMEEAVKEKSTNRLYSIEVVFNHHSAANVMMNLIREFSNNKGTVRKPNGLLQDKKDDLWKLLLSIYNEIDALLKYERKCQRVYSPCFIMGDIHGNLEDLFSLEKALWKQVPCVGANYLFLGDYVDRGQWGFECSLYLFAFKILCPNKVTLLRGNHEVRLLQSHYTYKKECMIKYGDLLGLKVWELSNRIFDKLPVCALVDEAVYCAHGGLPRSIQRIDEIRKINQELKDPEKESPAAWEILWSDPCHMQQFLEVADLLNMNPKNLNGYIKNTKRGTAFLFNEVGCMNFLRNNGLSHVVRAHEVPPLGYTFHFGNKCATIFSCSHYCGNDNDCACILADCNRLRVIHLDTVNNSSATD